MTSKYLNRLRGFRPIKKYNLIDNVSGTSINDCKCITYPAVRVDDNRFNCFLILCRVCRVKGQREKIAKKYHQRRIK